MPANDKSLDELHRKQSIVTQLLVAGTAACIADFATFPFDTAKGNHFTCNRNALTIIVNASHALIE